MDANLADLRAELSKPTKRERIADRLVAMLRAGLLRPGDELPGERDLAATLGVSRETVRGAVQTLVALGMIEVAHGARSRIAPSPGWQTPPASAPDGGPTLAHYHADEIHGARKAVEAIVVREAARRLSPAALERLAHLVQAQAAMFDDPVAFQISDLEFHVTIYRGGGNRLLAAFLSEVYDYALERRRLALLVPGAVRRSWLDHKAILAGLQARDGEAAAAAMARHLLRVYRTTLAVGPLS